MRISLTQFVRSKSGLALSMYLAFAAVVSAGVGYEFHHSSLDKFRTQKAEEKTTALRLVDAFVTTYSHRALETGTRCARPRHLPRPLDRRLQQAGGLEGRIPAALGGTPGPRDRNAAGRPRDGKNDRSLRRHEGSQAGVHAVDDRRPAGVPHGLSLARARAELRQLPQPAAAGHAAVAAQRRHGCVRHRRSRRFVPAGPRAGRAISSASACSRRWPLVGLAIAVLHFRQTSEREAAASELRTQNMLLDTALKNMSQGLCMFDADERLVIANRRYAEMYGLTPEQVKPGTTLRQILEYRIAIGAYIGSAPGGLHQRAARRRARTGTLRHGSRTLADGRVFSIVPPADGGWRLGRHARGHHRAAAHRGQDRTHGPARRADGPAQPHAAQRAAGACAGARQARRDRRHPPPRPRPLQERQRYARARRRRQAAEGRGRPPARARQGDGHHRAHGRRRVRDRAGRPRATGGRHDAGRADHRGDRRALRRRRPSGHRRDQRRHRRRADRRRRSRPADEECGPGALSRQERGTWHVSLLRAGHGRAHAGAARLEYDLRKALVAGEFELHYQPVRQSRPQRHHRRARPSSAGTIPSGA